MEFLKHLVVSFILKIKHQDLTLRSLKLSRLLTLGKGAEIGGKTTDDGHWNSEIYAYAVSEVKSRLPTVYLLSTD